MLPKVATQILHQTTRAAAAVQSQTSHTIRNVLQSNTTSNLGPWNGPGSSSSNWGGSSYGPGPGGAKYNAGNRFNHGYAGAGRAVSQANVITAHDALAPQSDDNDDLSTRRVSLHRRPKGSNTRARSHSLSFNAQDRHERGESLGVLRTVQIHARSRHAFASATITSESPLLLTDSPHRPSNSPRRLSRRNSTSIPTQSHESLDDLPSLPVTGATPNEPSISTDPAAPQTTIPPNPPATQEEQSPPLENGIDLTTFNLLRSARDKRDPSHTSAVVANFVASAEKPSVAEFNMALEALHESRRAGEPLTQLLETYNAMLTHSILPNVRTYFILILALTDRDNEVHRMVQSLALRSEKRNMAGSTHGAASISVDHARIEELKKENNFGTAMTLFEAVIGLEGNNKVPGPVYNNLLRSCAYHSSVNSAIHVFAQLERRMDIKPSAVSYLHMLSTFTNAGKIQGAQDVFEAFLAASRQNNVAWSVAPSKKDEPYDITRPHRLPSARNVQMQIWNKMIEAYFRSQPPDPAAAIGILQQMLDSNAPPSYGALDIPTPSSSTYTTILTGFINSGDLESALTWFDHLLAQTTAPRNPQESSKNPQRPDVVAWMVMFDALARACDAPNGPIEDLNRIFKIFCDNAVREGLEVRSVDRQILHNANMAAFRAIRRDISSFQEDQRQKVKARLDFVVEYVHHDSLHRLTKREMMFDLIHCYTQLGFLTPSINLLHKFVAFEMAHLPQSESTTDVTADNTRSFVLTTVAKAIDEVYASQKLLKTAVPFAAAIELARIGDIVGLLPSADNGGGNAGNLLQSYGLERRNGQVVADLRSRDWEMLLYAATEYDLPLADGTHQTVPFNNFAFAGTVSLLEDLAARNIEFDQLQRFIIRRVIQAIYLTHGVEELAHVFTRLGPSFERALNAPRQDSDALADSIATSPTASSVTAVMDTNSDIATGASLVKVDPYTSQWVDECLQVRNKVKPDPMTAFARFEQQLDKGNAPGPAVLSRLIQALGREGDLDKVRQVYTAAQGVLHSLAHKKEWQSQAWFLIEDSMIIALAHAGDLDSAHVHRMRVLDNGGAPSADAYGALILYVKETTDDTSNAMSLFREAQMQGVIMNLYLYNNIISKLAKARKADHALELFQEMKTGQLRPSSITYGALIGACARVGDAHSAEILFEEMVRQPNFKPRIPPYNTMIQLYTTTKLNRDRALFYYNALINVGIRPSAHTYKLLLDVYGTVEPVDINSMQQVFNALENDHSVPIQGPHWASLINAWGCVVKDLDKAIETFASIPSHPRSSQGLPDAVVFEAMVNVLAAHRRTDLMPLYMEKMNAAGVHMTAYIANCLIRGYASVGDLEQARAIFESLHDPPGGVAAPNNHAPHEPGQALDVEPMAPVYREPSTWEAMVRAELGAGQRDRAVSILERLHARHYPEAVYNRISGIMLDQSGASPWGVPNSPAP
ncbi:hypothetical protein HGRIS_009881 [Hohenbuehelia grisea]|uniref:PROP1-like PPR domain-containing protein n=1 Tax=Hohenbuehelia grisea TaxID=104357 RepID=A0ABR3J2L5_9AGAR